MNAAHRTFGRVCEHCPLCSHARNNKDGKLYKVMDSLSTDPGAHHGRDTRSWKPRVN